MFARGHRYRKNHAQKALASAIDSRFQRIQFTLIYSRRRYGFDNLQQETGQFSFNPWPIMNDIVAGGRDQRAPAKVNAALLEAMGERPSLQWQSNS